MEELDNSSSTNNTFKEDYILYVVRNGATPVTVYKFCEDLGVQETEFYNHYTSFKTLEKEVWKDFFEQTHSILQADENYALYSAYEKWLSFLYTLIEQLKKNRSFVVFRTESIERKNIRPWFLNAFRKAFNHLIAEIINQGIANEEIAKRPIITDKYNEVLWVQFLYILRVWTNDESDDFQTTDAAIEKSSVLLFELMKKGPIDLLIDFVKFAYQNKAY